MYCKAIIIIKVNYCGTTKLFIYEFKFTIILMNSIEIMKVFGCSYIRTEYNCNVLIIVT